MLAPLAIAALALAAAGQEIGDLAAKLRDRDDVARQGAVKALAKLDTGEAWQLVAGALADRSARVADEAELQIAAIDDAAGRASILGKDGLGSKDELVRARVAEAFGRMASPPDSKALAAPLRDDAPEVRRLAAWSIERLARAGTIDAAVANALAPDLERVAAKDKIDGVRAAAVVARALLEPVGTRRAHADAALAAKEADVRAAGVLVAGELDPAAALEIALRARGDVAVGVRLCAADLLASLATKPAVLALAECLESERELRARWRVVDHLQRLSGLSHRLDPRPWRAWAEALPADWTAGERAASEPERDLGEATASFVGLPILSERVAFLIDLSGSMWAKRADGTTRKEEVDRELARALERLAPPAEFNVIPYVERPVAWQPRLAVAKPAAVAKALEFFGARRDQGTGDAWDALALALEDPRVDTLVVLSDGAPTGDSHWNIGLLRALFAERNRFRRVALDAVLADPTAFLERQWREWCAETGGRCVVTSLR